MAGKIHQRQQGRTDSARRLERQLPSASPAYVEGALRNPALDENLLTTLLTNPELPERILNRIARNHDLVRSDTVKAALVRHPSTPPEVSMRLVAFLGWRELAEIGHRTRLPPGLRAHAEQILAGRMNQLPHMERAKLARTGSRPVLTALLRTRDTRLIVEVLRNPRLLEQDVAALSVDTSLPGAALAAIARDEKWFTRPAIRWALVENPSTPFKEAKNLLPGIPLYQLRTLQHNARVSAQVRTEAAKLVKSGQRAQEARRR